MRLRTRPSFPSGGDLGPGAMPSTPGRRGGRSAFRVALVVLFLAGLVIALPRFAGAPQTGAAVEQARAQNEASRPGPAGPHLAQAGPTVAPALAPPQASDTWQKMPKMKLEAVFGGPLRDTIVQRYRDPVDGTVCYLYLPINAPTSAVQPSGFVQYGASTIGSISCFAGAVPAPQVAAKQPASPPGGPAAPAKPPAGKPASP